LRRYDRNDLGQTIRAAQDLSARDGLTYFVYASSLGYGIYRFPPTFYQGYYAIKGGNVEPVNRND